MRFKSSRFSLLGLLFLVTAVGLISCSNKTATKPASSAALLINYPSTTGGGNYIGDGLDITSYPGTSLSSIVLWISSGAGSSTVYTFTLAATDSCYGGTAIGTATSGSVTLDGNDTDNLPVTFSFSGNPSVTKTHAVALDLAQATGPIGTTYFSTSGNFGGLTGAAIGVNDLNDMTPCLSTVRYNGFAILVYGNH